MRRRKVRKPRLKRYIVALSESEMRRLTRFAAESKVDRPTALHRLISQSLRNAVAELPQKTTLAPNQLSLFDSLQIDIFDNTHKVNNQQ